MSKIYFIKVHFDGSVKPKEAKKLLRGLQVASDSAHLKVIWQLTDE